MYSFAAVLVVPVSAWDLIEMEFENHTMMGKQRLHFHRCISFECDAICRFEKFWKKNILNRH